MQAALNVIEAYNSWDLDNIMATRAPECIAQILPKSLGRPEMGNTAYSQYLSTMMPAFTGFHVNVNDIIEDTKNNKVNVWARSTADTPVGPYSNEYMLVFHFDDKQEKLIKFYEFVDSKYSAEHFGKMREFAEAKAKEAAASA